MSRPLVLVGDTRSRAMVARLQSLGWGRVFIAEAPTIYPGEPWVLDNGMFGAWRNGSRWDWGLWNERLQRARELAGDPLFAVAPDCPGEGEASLAWSLACMAGGALAYDVPWYLAVQDGMRPADVREHWESVPFDGLFLGGTNPWKVATAASWRDLAWELGCPFHYARAGTLPKLRHAMRLGADSLDSAFPLWEVQRFEAFASVWLGREAQPALWREEAGG